MTVSDSAFDGCSEELTFIGYSEVLSEDTLQEYATTHGFKYLENEKYWGDG